MFFFIVVVVGVVIFVWGRIIAMMGDCEAMAFHNNSI